MKFVVATLALAGYVSAICPGFNYGIGTVQPLGAGFNRCKLSSAQWHLYWPRPTSLQGTFTMIVALFRVRTD